MKRFFTMLFLVFACLGYSHAQSAQVTFSSATNFLKLEDGFHPVSFQLTNGSNADVAGLLAYVHDNQNYFMLQVNGKDLNLKFKDGLDWGVWLKVFASMGVSQIEVREPNQNLILDPMGFLKHFNLIKQ